MLSVNTFAVCLFFVVVIRCGLGYGDYVPKLVYQIDENGKESDHIYVKTKRDVKDVLLRIKRGGGAYSYSGSSSGPNFSGGIDPASELAQLQSNIEKIAHDSSHIPNQILSRFQENTDSFPAGSGAYSYSGSTGSSGNHGSGYSGNNAGYRTGSAGQGPNLFSRSGVDRGTGIKVSSAAQGPHAAFSYSSSAADGQGNVKYNVKSGQY